jgi:hypothetical protein
LYCCKNGWYSTVQYSTVQYSTAQYSRVQYSTVQNSTAQYSTVKYSTVQYSTVQYSTIQYSTVQYSTVQYSTVHIYTQTVHRTTQFSLGRVRAVPRLCQLYPGICLTTEEKARKNLSQGSRRVPVGTMRTEYTEQYIHNNKNT